MLTARSHNSTAAVEAMMSEFRVQPSIVHEAGTQRTAAKLVRHSDAVGFLDHEIVATLPAGALIALALDPVPWSINLLYRRDRKPRRCLRRCCGGWRCARSRA